MSADPLAQLAERAGLVIHWHDYRGTPQTVGADTLRALLTAMGLVCATAEQCRESLRQLESEAQTPAPTELAEPARAFTLDELDPQRRFWGIAVQLYSLRDPHDGGFGDFSTLADFARRAAASGADALAISPVHALFTADLDRFGPYSPSSRLFLNPLYASPGRAENSPELQHLRSLSLIDWPRAGRLRLAQLRATFDEMRVPHATALAEFRRERGPTLEDHARFEALHAQQLAHGGRWSWREWPAALRNPRSAEVAAFAAGHAVEIEFQVFLQWLAERGFGQAQRAARQAGMRIGLIADLAVGTDPHGSHAWSRPDDFLARVSVGAPPDLLNQQGQNWGLTAFSPRALREQAYAPFIETLRASLRHAGGLRIDHVLGLNRLWLVPEGAGGAEGAYLRYPLDELLRVAAAESARHRALIVGEDLGTVPPGFSAQLTAAGLMGMRVLWFENEHGLFREPSRWPVGAMATTTTHDLPTIAGWWSGRDLDWRARVGQLVRDPQGERAQRSRDRGALWDAFVHAGVAKGEPPADAAPVVEAALRFVARTPSKLAMLPIEDVCGLEEQPNLPGTIDQHPNWRRRLPLPGETLFDDASIVARLRAVRDQR